MEAHALPLEITSLTEEIVALCSPLAVWLFSAKRDLKQRITSFKLCIVADTDQKALLEQKLYLSLDCPVPYDIILYTKEEWSLFSGQEFSFAYTIRQKGVLLYGETPE